MALVDSSTIQASEMWLRRRFSLLAYCCWSFIICDYVLQSVKGVYAESVDVVQRCLKALKCGVFKFVVCLHDEDRTPRKVLISNVDAKNSFASY